MTLQFRLMNAVGLALCIGCSTYAATAHAALGAAYSSVETDRIHLSAKIKSTAAATYTAHALTLANGGVVTELTRPDGMVFAVTWRGPGRPDLRQLLGSHFDTLQADNATRVGRRIRRPMVVNRADFIVQTGGHSGAFWGVALLPQMEPAGFSANDLK